LISECNLKQEELGDRVGKKRTTVNNYLRLLKLPPDIQAGIRDDKISMGHARALINIENIALQLDIYKKIIKDDLSVRKVEDLVRKLGMSDNLVKKEHLKPEPDPELKQLQTALSSHFGTKIEIMKKGEKKGEIKIPYFSDEDLNRIIEILEIRL
jgi:ParB family chromosome partitioning protein